MKQRFIHGVTNALSAAPDSTAKGELIEELADNLYHRYLDMTAAGLSEDEAFERAMGELGDTEELVDYLKSLAPEEELPRLTLHPDKDEQLKKDVDEILHNVEEMVRGAMNQASSALHDAKDTLRNVLGKKGMSFRSDDGQFELHIDNYDDDHGEHPYGEDHEGYAFVDEHCEVGDGGIPSEGLRGIDIQTINGDVTIRLIDDETAPIHLEDYDGLEVKRTDDNVLSIRPENTATSSFFFGRGIFSGDVELYLPRRYWEFVQVTTATGDVTVEDDIEVGRLSVKTASGDLTADCAACGSFHLKSASGDCRVSGLTGQVQVETMTGDVTAHGHMTRVRLSSMSGDVELDGAFTHGQFSSMSGDVRLETGILPETLEVSSKSGDCQVYLPGDQGGFTLRYKTTSGDFRSQLPLTRTERGAVYQDGGNRTFVMSSTSGDLRVRKF